MYKIKISEAELPTEISAARWRPGGKNHPKIPEGKKCGRNQGLRSNTFLLDVYKLIEIGRKKLRKVKKGCSKA